MAHAQNVAQNWLGITYKGLSDVRKAVIIDMAYNMGNKIKQFEKLKSALDKEDHR